MPLAGRETQALGLPVELEMVMSIAQDSPKRVGNIEMAVRFAPPTPENQEKWDRRAEALAAWLLAQWERQQLAAIAARN